MAYRETEATRSARARRKAEILRAATGIVAAQGFRAASAKAIAAAAGVSPGTIYTYFDTRETLLTAVFAQRAQHELDAVRHDINAHADNPLEQLRTLVRTFAGRAAANRQLAWAMLVEPVDVGIEEARLEYRRAYTDTTEDILLAGIAAGVIPDQHARLSASALVGAIGEALVGPLSVFAPTAQSQPVPPPAELITQITSFCLRAAGANCASERSAPAPAPSTSQQQVTSERSRA